MSFKTQLITDMKNAMKARDKSKLEVIRYLLAQIKNTEIDKGELSDPQCQQIVSKLIKQGRDVIVQFQQAKRDDLVASEEAKLVLLSDYLPKQMSDTELESIIDKVVADLGDQPNLGQVIGIVMKQSQGQADGGRVSTLVRRKLA